MKRTLTLLLAALLLLASCSKVEPSETAKPSDPAETQPVESLSAETETNAETATAAPIPGEAVATTKTVSMVQPKSYEEIYEKLASWGGYWGWNRRYADNLMVEDFAFAEEAMEVPMEMPAADADMAVPEAESYSADKADYSETNAQVAGIDEGDIVKTDGKYIYVLNNNRLLILSAAGADSEVLSETVIAENGEPVYYAYDDFAEEEKYSVEDYETAREMYISGTTLAVIKDCSSWGSGYVDGIYRYENHNYTLVDFYDVSDPTAPRFMDSEGQDGYYLTSRLKDGKLYLLTNYYVNRYYDYDEDDYHLYIPQLYANGARSLLPPDCIVYPEGSEESSYTVISRLNMETPSVERTESILGAGSTVYMSANYLYLADTRYFEEATGERTESVYTVTDWRYGDETEILKLSFENEIEVVASGVIYGSLLNQFSMDEYDGKLRAVTTDWNNSYTIYEDKAYGFSNYQYKDSKQTNGLYVFDEGMNVIGSVTDLAPDERVYSVRFDGEVGYFVTFRQVDPLFTVDLSDPENPQIMSALKIPGFSNYLHPYADGLLFGLGQNADEETGRTQGMKLSMFDVSDKFDVYERDKISLDITYSEGLYNHKAILIAPNKGLIGFPSTNGYLLYTYSTDDGFRLFHEVKLNDEDWWWNSDSRGLYVGDDIYIVTSDFTVVIDMNSGELLARVGYDKVQLNAGVLSDEGGRAEVLADKESIAEGVTEQLQKEIVFGEQDVVTYCNGYL